MTEENKEITIMKIRGCLDNHGITALNTEFHEGPVVSTAIAFLEKKPSKADLNGLTDGLSKDFDRTGVRISVKGFALVIEFPNEKSERKYPEFRESVDSFDYAKGKNLPLFLGYDTGNNPVVADLSECPHILISGAVCQGNGILQKSMVNSLLNAKKQGDLKFLLVDSKAVNLGVYDKLDRNWFYGDGILVSPDDVNRHLNSLCEEMNARFRILSENRCSSAKLYRLASHADMPDIVVVISDYADYMAGNSEDRNAFLLPLIRLAQLGRTVGIHCIISTQRPDTEHVSCFIKANFPTRIATRCNDRLMSNLILDCDGAESLIGHGDMIFSNGKNPVRFQGLNVSDEDTEAAIEKANAGIQDVIPISQHSKKMERISVDVLPDETKTAARLIVEKGQAYAALVQRALGWGYSKTARTMELLEAAKIVGPLNDGMREVLVKDIDELECLLKKFGDN